MLFLDMLLHNKIFVVLLHHDLRIADDNMEPVGPIV